MIPLTLASLRVRLLILVILAVLPALGLTLYSVTEERQLAAAQAQEGSLRLVRLISNDHTQLIEGSHQILAVMAQLPEIRSGDSSKCSQLFTDMLKQYPYYTNFGLIRTNGDLFCSSTAYEGPVNLSDRAYFKRALQTREFSVGDYQMGRATGNHLIYFAHPVLGETGQILSVLTVSLDLNWLNKLASEVELPPGTSLTVMDRNGLILSRYPDPEKWVGKSVPEVPIVKKVLEQQSEGTARSTGMDGTERLYAFKPLYSKAEGGGVFIYTGTPTKTIFAGPNRLLSRNLSGIGLVIVLVLAITWVAGNRFFLRQVDDILGATQKLAAGDLNARTGLPHGQGELGRLAQAFDEMADALEQHTLQLQINEKRLRLITDNILDMICLTSPDFIIKYASPAFKRYLDILPEELVGKAIFDRAHPDDLPGIMASVKNLKNKSDVREEFRYRHADGYYLWLEATGNILKEDDTVVGAVFTCRDISQRKRMEDGLQKLSHQNELILSSAGEGIFGLNLQGRITFINPAAANMLGYEVAKLVAGHIHSICHHSRSDGSSYPEEECPIYMAYNDGLVHHRADEIFWRRDGTSFPVEYVSTPIREQGQLVGAVVVFKDITQRRQAEDRIRLKATRSRALAEISQDLTEVGLDYQAVLDTVVRRTAQLIGDTCVIRLLSDDGQWLNLAALYHPDSEVLSSLQNLHSDKPVSVKEEPFRRVIQNGQAIFIPVIPQDQLHASGGAEYQPYLEYAGIYSYLLAPLRVQGQVIGTIGITRDYPVHPYTADDQTFLQDLADRMALAITNSRLFSENLRQLKTISALYDSAQKLSQSQNLEELVKDVTRTCVEAFGVRLAWLGRAEADGSVRLMDHYPPDSQFPHHVKVRWDDSSLGQGVTGRAINSGIPVLVTDISTDPNFAPWREIALKHGFCSAAGFPLISRDTPFGILTLFTDEPNYFTPGRIEFFEAYAHQVAATLEKARLFDEAQRRFEHLQALRNIDIAITGSLDLRVTLNVVVDQVIKLGIHAAAILLLSPHTQTLEYATGVGFRQKGIEGTNRRLGEGNPGRAALTQRIVQIPDLMAAGESFKRGKVLKSEGFIAYCGLPLVAKGQVKGVLEIFRRSPLSPETEWLDFLEILARQAAIAIDNATLFNDLQRSNVELRLAYDATIEGLSYALDLRDKETEGHSQRVTEVTVRLARYLGVSNAELVHIRWGALLHDIGKMGVPDSILLKPGPLSGEEWEVMRRHPVYAFEMLSSINHLRLALDIPYCHHEKWDGTGYPRGLNGKQIPLAARIFAVVDVWDALRSERPYRPAWKEDKVREHIRSLAGTHFDPKVAEMFLKMEWQQV